MRGKVPGLPTSEVTEVAFQTTRLGFRTDDILVKVHSHQGEHQLLAQVKHNLTISTKDETFAEVMTALWQDFTNQGLFNPALDRLLIIKSELTQVDKRDTIMLLDWAKAKASADDFYQEVNRIDKKEKALKVLSDVLQKANGGQAVDQKRLWQFLRCMVILEYDFGQESSNSETNFLNLIKLAKSPKCSVSEKEIWDSVYVFVADLNKNGGSVTLESLQSELFATYFDPSRLYDSFASIKKLSENGQVIIGSLSNTIDSYHLPRTELREELMTAIASQKLTILIGEPGAGKSAITKEVISDIEPDTSVFIFKADQFNKPHLSQVFTEQGIHDDITQLFTCLASIPNKLIVIDSFEKLLESDDPNNAFRQFIHVVNDLKDVRVIATSRTYAVDLLVQKYALTEVSIVTVPLLSDAEFQQITKAFPRLQPLVFNPQLNQLLRSPKYLDFTVGWVLKTTEDLSQLTVTEFKDKLWQHIVENYTVTGSGMRSKRRKAFIEVSVLRAKRMTLYAEPEEADDEALESLVKDNVLSESNTGGQFTPSHDILEDWALIKYIRRVRESNPDAEDFYRQIGNEPALRRAFRLWVEESLHLRAAIIFELVRETHHQAGIERYWADEVLVAIFRSNESIAFFEEFETELLQDKAQFLQRAIHLLRTACKERRFASNNTLLYPVGSGWAATLSFVQQHLAQLDTLRPLITGLLVDWSYSIYKEHDNDLLVEINSAKFILFSYLREIENWEKIWEEESLKNKMTSLIDIAFELTEYAQSDIKAIIERAMPGPTYRYDYHDKSFYGLIRKMTLSGVSSHKLTEFLPEQVIAMAKATWIRKPRVKKSTNFEGLSPINKILDLQDEYNYDSLDRDIIFGLENNFNYSPSGIYKTPVYNLLLTNWKWGIDFLSEMINHCTEHYVKSGKVQEEDVVEVQLYLLDGQRITQSGSHVLWQAYRGTTVSSYLLESLLMSLEAYLLRMAKLKTEVSQKNIRFLYDYLLHRSNSVAVSGVLVSIAIAYPQEIGESMLPLLGARKFYEWDVHRALEDHTGALAPYDSDIPSAQKVRYESNQLPHRTKYYNGLKGFVLELQLNLKLFNEILYTVFDRMWNEADEQDIYWRKSLYEIDSRKWQITEFKPEDGAFIIQPAYEPDIQKIVDDYQPRQEYQQQAATTSVWLREVYDQKKGVSVEYIMWETVFERYYTVEDFDVVHDRPITLAVVGLRNFINFLTPMQQNWCYDTIVKAVNMLILGTTQRSSYLESRFVVSPFDQEIALTALPLLIKTTEDTERRRFAIKLLFRVLITQFAKHEMVPILASLREQLWEVDTVVADQIWHSLIRFAKLRKAQEKDQWRAYQDEELQKRIFLSVDVFVEDMAQGKFNENIDFEQIKLTTWHSHFLTRAFMMLPYNTREVQHLNYRKTFIPLFLKGLNKDLNREERFDSRPLIHSDDRISLQQYLCDYFLYCDHEDAADIAELLLVRIFQVLASPSYFHDDGYDFVKWTLEMTISELDQIVYNRPESIDKRTTENFWRIWGRFHQVLIKSDKRLFANLLFLEIGWKQESVHWKPLEGKKKFIKQCTDSYGHSNIRPLIKLLATVGDQTLLPEGLRWVVGLVKKSPENLHPLAFDGTEILINRLYQRHIVVIKTDISLLNDFIWLLDKMVDFGSSQAYITRENLITYKK